MLALAVHGWLMTGFGWYDVSSPWEPRIRNQASALVAGHLGLHPGDGPFSLYVGERLRLVGNSNYGFPHAPADVEFSCGVRYERPAFWFDVGHSSWHRIPGLPVFDFKQWVALGTAGVRF